MDSKWTLTYCVNWESICKSIEKIYDFFTNSEILVNGKIMLINNKNDILKINEASSITIRGKANIIKSSIMITFYNQLDIVYVSIDNDDFKKLFLANPVYNIRFYSKYGEEYKYLQKAYKFLENKKLTENKDLIEIEKFFYQCY